MTAAQSKTAPNDHQPQTANGNGEEGYDGTPQE